MVPSDRSHGIAASQSVADVQEEEGKFREGPVRTLNKRPRVPLGGFPTANVVARWESLQTMMGMTDVGVFEYLPSGKLIHANEAWYRLSNHPRNLPAHVEFSFMDLAYPDDQATIMYAWNTLIQGNCVTFEMRWKAKPGSEDDAQWVLSACVPVFDEDQNLISIAGNTIDINDQKKLQEVQRRQIEEALEAKRQQENFIDMTSHELRTPLSGIVQCADSVISTLQQLTPKEFVLVQPQFEKSSPKRIIDDVLTLSKLDSKLLLITPILVQPSLIVSEAMKMFEVECSQMQIRLVFQEDESLSEFEWVMIDPSRMLQVLIKLLTNAIKFTKDREIRNVTVTLGGSWTHTHIEDHSMTFAKDTHSQFNICDEPEWAKLFSRFTQATPRTHIEYGGSGLGLFILKSLTVLQGGFIGVKSTADSGSSFVFYISARIAEISAKTTEKKLQRPAIRYAVSAEDAMRNLNLDILVVEDNLVNQKVLSKQLQKAGCNVSVVGNGVEALEWLKTSVYWKGEQKQDDTSACLKSDIDIVLMDIEMPVMDGLTCARQIRHWGSQGLLASPTAHGPLIPQLTSTSVSPLIPLHDMAITTQTEVD
ncbi:hypothetical protein SLS60_007746 [Paraconiothyrium brasiliense]|uniref:Histidine kinase n=1 Tax=Paraconiothyrium brasiliense TaxID=300254 RepID=A0ABR3R2G3_9PLEO